MFFAYKLPQDFPAEVFEGQATSASHILMFIFGRERTEDIFYFCSDKSRRSVAAPSDHRDAWNKEFNKCNTHTHTHLYLDRHERLGHNYSADLSQMRKNTDQDKKNDTFLDCFHLERPNRS